MKKPGRITKRVVRTYNSLLSALGKITHKDRNNPVINEILEYSSKNKSDKDNDLVDLFTESFKQQPLLIIELGIKNGDSSFVFERVACLAGE